MKSVFHSYLLVIFFLSAPIYAASITNVYTLDIFSRYYAFGPRHTIYTQWEKKTEFGTWLARLSGAKHQLDTSAYQVELDAYSSIFGKAGYTYITIGRASGFPFPDWRFGLEGYVPVWKETEVSFGVRYLDFRENKTLLYILSVGHYIDRYWIAGRGYASYQAPFFSTSGYVTVRWYSDDDSYISFLGGMGTVPSDPLLLAVKERLFFYTFGIEAKTRFPSHFFGLGGIQFTKEEYSPGQWGDHVTLSLGMKMILNSEAE